MRPSRQLILSVTLACSLGACSFMPDEPLDTSPKLNALEPARLPDVSYPVPEVQLAQVADSYQKALEVTEDPRTQRQIRIRLADLEMQRAQEMMLASEVAGRFFDRAIGLYQELIANTEQGASDTDDVQARDQLLYQLAKAHALDGDTDKSEAVLASLVDDHPQSDFVAEAKFRQAERSF
uniref:tetratricopeptide repeat protein n=1 Tax=uncultured Paraglaciecola sp. TaxID=1765024 RepID=UPI0025E11815